MDNDKDCSGPIDPVVAAHVDFATEMSFQMGGIKVAICSPLHRMTPHFLSMEAYNDNVDECNSILRDRLDTAHKGLVKGRHILWSSRSCPLPPRHRVMPARRGRFMKQDSFFDADKLKRMYVLANGFKCPDLKYMLLWLLNLYYFYYFY